MFVGAQRYDGKMSKHPKLGWGKEEPKMPYDIIISNRVAQYREVM